MDEEDLTCAYSGLRSLASYLQEQEEREAKLKQKRGEGSGEPLTSTGSLPEL